MSDPPSSAEPLPHLFLRRARRRADEVAYRARAGGEWRPTSWAQAQRMVEECALGLADLGVRPGDAVAIMSSTRPEWALLDMANLCLGAITVGVYPNLNRGELRRVLTHSGARVIVVEDAAKGRMVDDVAATLSHPTHIVTLGEGPALVRPVDAAPARHLSYTELRHRGAARRARSPDALERRVAERKPDEVVSYVYSTDAGGASRAVMLSHRNFHYVVQATNALVPYAQERVLVFLSMAHSLQRYASYLNLLVDVDVSYGGSLGGIFDDLHAVRPTCFAVVPRMLEQLHYRVVARGRGARGWSRAGFERAVAALHAKADHLRAGREPGVRGRIRARVADRLVGRRIRTLLGGRTKFIGTGGGLLDPDVHAFFEDVGIPILSGYGLTETCAPACLNTLDSRRLGTVGRPLPGTEVRIAPDGEVQIRGPGVFEGYHRDEKATAAAFTDDGWFRTGDSGRMSRDGFLTLQGKQRDLITTATGDNVAPQALEVKIRRHPWIEDAVVVGRGRPYLGALLSLRSEALSDVATELGLRSNVDSSELAGHPLVQEHLREHLATVNAGQPAERQIQRFSVVAERFSTDSGELSPTLEVQRQVVETRRQRTIERLYRP